VFNARGKRGRKHADGPRTVVDAILYLVQTGSQRRYLPEFASVEGVVTVPPLVSQRHPGAHAHGRHPPSATYVLAARRRRAQSGGSGQCSPGRTNVGDDVQEIGHSREVRHPFTELEKLNGGSTTRSRG
jgi:hypothetical protein